MEKEEKKPAKKRRVGRPRKDRRGGARPGAGRKPGSGAKENPRNKTITFRVSALTKGRIDQIREMIKGEDGSFTDMLTRWVDELADTYGVE